MRERGPDRRTTNRPFFGPDRRRSNYDRRKLTQPRKLRPAMSPNASRPIAHDAGYVARFVADESKAKRASSHEVRMAYQQPRRTGLNELTRGLCLDRNIR